MEVFSVIKLGKFVKIISATRFIWDSGGFNLDSGGFNGTYKQLKKFGYPEIIANVFFFRCASWNK